MSAWTRLQRIIRLLYHGNDDDVRALTDTLIEARTRAWTVTMQAEAQRFGYSGAVKSPRGADLMWIRRESRQDAESIIRTWNRDVDRQIKTLFAQNYRGNRFYYGKHLEEWAEARARWKNTQIAMQTEFRTASYVLDRFRQKNGLQDGLYMLVGPPPVCGVCVFWYDAGVVDRVTVEANPAPFHFRCPHLWELLIWSVIPPPPDRLWVG